MSSRQNLLQKDAPRLSKNKPRFVNPVPLPAIAEFRLDHILAKILPQETASVSVALLNVCSNYQQDLKGEIRKALAIEQKIQNKNIHAIKQTHKLTKQLNNSRKQLARVASGKSENRQTKNKNSLKRRNTGLASEVDEVLVQSISVSENIKALAVRMAEISAKRGGPGMPDMHKYPRLNKLLLTSLRPENGADLDEERLTIRNPVSTMENEEFSMVRLLNSHNPTANQFYSVYTGASKRDSEIKPKNDVSTETGPEIRSSGIFNGPENNDEAMDLHAFEMFMDASIAKYRERQGQRIKTLASSVLEAGTTAILKTARNPLKLLSSGAIGLNNQRIKLSPFSEQSDPFKYLFLPRKSPATVLETPELSLHKKLRIRVLPSPLKTAVNLQCGCRPEKRPKPAQNGDLWSSSKALLETEIDSDSDSDSGSESWSGSESESVLGISSLSDANSSSDSLGSHIGETNRYYRSLQSNMRLKRKNRRHRKSRKSVAPNAESSPSPKHQPLHRVLQPKQSILKLARGKADPYAFKTNVPIELQLVHTEELTYTASPRASFINEYAVLGMIVQGTRDGPVDMKNTGLVLEEDPNNLSRIVDPKDPEENGECGSLGNKQEGSHALNKLKSLIL